MILFLIGIVVAFLGYKGLQKSEEFSHLKNIPILVGSLVALSGLLSSSIVIIESGSVGVKTLFGKVSNSTLSSGLQFVNPFMQVTKFSTQTQNYTMSGVHNEATYYFRR